ncbi:hypothetical protein TI39_contig615g00009 [Zymoseptoria brevis]|uniref:Uncharacterized protein n=1 Tax=Zymoseptoria brevis TaxID=1047168 RepID=A0A0F4GHP2_9PEZI|nr:hypothetical protein TI39_contig615g00009 [Zymoseptoria brevis]
MGNGISFEASDLTGAVTLGQGIVTSYGFKLPTRWLLGSLLRSHSALPVATQPILTFPVSVPGGAADVTTTSVVTCTPFNNGVLPTSAVVTNQLTCGISNTPIAPGRVTVNFRRSNGGQFIFSTTYVFSVASAASVTTSTSTATTTTTVDTTVGSTTVTDTTYLATIPVTPTTTLTGASSTIYVSCSTDTTSPTTTTGTATNSGTTTSDSATADPGTPGTDSSSTASGTATTASSLSSTTSGTATANPETTETSSSATSSQSSSSASGTATADPETTTATSISTSSSILSPKPYSSPSSSTSCTASNAKPYPTTLTKVIKTITKTACKANTAALYPRQNTATDVLAAGFGGPDFTFSGGNNVATITSVTTSTATASRVTTDGTDTVVVTSPLTTSTVTTTTVTEDERTVSTPVATKLSDHAHFDHNAQTEPPWKLSGHAHFDHNAQTEPPWGSLALDAFLIDNWTASLDLSDAEQRLTPVREYLEIGSLGRNQYAEKVRRGSDWKPNDAEVELILSPSRPPAMRAAAEKLKGRYNGHEPI